MSARRGGRFSERFAGLQVTRGAMIVAFVEIGMSLVWLLSGPDGQKVIVETLAATPASVFEHGRVWTLVTSPLLETNFLGLVLHIFVLFMFIPTLERFWGTPRFFRFLAITSIAATATGCAFGFLVGIEHAILGLSPFVYASIVAFGIIYARQPVQFFGVLPLTGRQLMWGILGFLVLFVVLGAQWVQGVAFLAAITAAALLTSKRFSPILSFRRWRIARSRRKLSVLDGGKRDRPGKKTYLN